ncbi:zinc finger protein 532 isoform X2 [Stigmatopora argus]
MADMKTPDFEDLLAAFDIPDMVDPKAAIEAGLQDEHDSTVKQAKCGSTTNDDVGVSVIVKNIRNMDSSQHDGTLSGKDLQFHPIAHSLLGNKLENGFSTPMGGDYVKNGWNELTVCKQASTYNEFSPFFIREELEEEKIRVGDPNINKIGQPFVKSATKKEKHQSKHPSSVKNLLKSEAKDFKPDQNNNENITLESSIFNSTTQSRLFPEEPTETLPSSHCKENNVQTCQIQSKTSAKLSCIAAIAALSTKKESLADYILDSPISQAGSNRDNENSREPGKKREQESALEIAKRLLSGPPDSPSSVHSESSATDDTPVIPKVRIKTIKTSSGQIKHTVTRVVPDLDLDRATQDEHIANGVTVKATSGAFLSSAIASLPTTVVPTRGGPSIEITKQMTIKPVATAFLPVSAVKTAGSQVINLKLSNNTTVKATVIPAASVQSAGSAILKAANSMQQQTVMVPASSLAKAKLLPKAINFSHLNLLTKNVSSKGNGLQKPMSTTKQSPKQQGFLTRQSSKKQSRVQVFSSSHSSVVDAFNKVLSSINPIPVYVPNLSPPTAACISIPSRGYKCLECGDSFALEKSLTQHYERRSVRIEVTCNHCSKSLVFYNKCSLLSHARGHKDKGVVMQCSHLILKPIPADQMIPTWPFSGATINAEGIVSECATQALPVLTGKVPSGGAQSGVISVPSSAPIEAAMPLEDDASKLCRHSLKCSECNEAFQDDSSLATHYQQVMETSGQKICSICQMLLPNHCSFLCHQRIHQQKSPYTCPECGASCRSVHFQSHLTKNCLHYTRKVGYRCTHCSVIFADVATLKSHIQNTHSEIFYKCSLCPMAFKTAPATHSHTNTQHPGLKAGEPKLIYKCSMCDTVFTLQSLLSSHFDQHIVNHKVPVFKCPDCSLHYAKKQLMLDHIKSVHGTVKIIEGPPTFGLNLPLSIKTTNSNNNGASNNNKEGGNETKDAPTSLKTPNKSTSGELKNNNSSGYTCNECNLIFTSKEPFVAHMKGEHGKKLKKHPCQLCEKSFSSTHSLCRHNRFKHKGVRKVYTCPQCPALVKSFTKRALLDQHIQLVHGTSEEKTATSETRPNLPNVSPKRKKEEGSLGLNSRTLDMQPLKRLKVNIPKVHRCTVCGFTTEDVPAFRKHIPQHKSDGLSYQCQECGLCYTSPRSKARHLFIVHRLKDQGLNRLRGKDDDENQRENQADVAVDTDDGTPKTKCKVCGKLFETEGNLNTHMRTHGMAFIKAKRLNSAEK